MVIRPAPDNGTSTAAVAVAPLSSVNDEVMLSVAERGPSAVGVNVMLPVHDWFGKISAQPAVPANSVEPTKAPAAPMAETLP